MADLFADAVPASADWDAPTRPSAGEDLSSINSLLREILAQATRPRSRDLTGDLLACAILRQWARQPWQEAHRAALVDRMEEGGATEGETAWARANAFYCCRWQQWSRTLRREACRVWRRMLTAQFGDFENTLREGTEDTRQRG